MCIYRNQSENISLYAWISLASSIVVLHSVTENIFFQNTRKSGSGSIITHFEAHNNAIFDVAWVPGKKKYFRNFL
jgi:hypothetical protein